MEEIDFLAFDLNRESFRCKAISEKPREAQALFRDIATKNTTIDIVINKQKEIEEYIEKNGGGQFRIIEFTETKLLKCSDCGTTDGKLGEAILSPTTYGYLCEKCEKNYVPMKLVEKSCIQILAKKTDIEMWKSSKYEGKVI